MATSPSLDFLLSGPLLLFLFILAMGGVTFSVVTSLAVSSETAEDRVCSLDSDSFPVISRNMCHMMNLLVG